MSSLTMKAAFEECVRHAHPAKRHTDDFNDWLDSSVVELCNSKGFPMGDYFVKVSKVKILRPQYQCNDRLWPLYPEYARINGISYCSTWEATLSLCCSDGDVLSTVKRVPIANIPIMVHSKACNLHGMDDATLMLMGEDPHDKGVSSMAPSTCSCSRKTWTSTRYTSTARPTTQLMSRKFTLEHHQMYTFSLPGLLKHTRQAAAATSSGGSSASSSASISFNVLRIFRILGVTGPSNLRSLMRRYIPSSMHPSDVERCFAALNMNRIQMDIKDMSDYEITGSRQV